MYVETASDLSAAQCNIGVDIFWTLLGSFKISNTLSGVNGSNKSKDIAT